MFPETAITYDHKFDGFRQQKCIGSQFNICLTGLKSGCGQGCAPALGSWGESIPSLFLLLDKDSMQVVLLGRWFQEALGSETRKGRKPTEVCFRADYLSGRLWFHPTVEYWKTAGHSLELPHSRGKRAYVFILIPVGLWLRPAPGWINSLASADCHLPAGDWKKPPANSGSLHLGAL